MLIKHKECRFFHQFLSNNKTNFRQFLCQAGSSLTNFSQKKSNYIFHKLLEKKKFWKSVEIFCMNNHLFIHFITKIIVDISANSLIWNVILILLFRKCKKYYAFLHNSIKSTRLITVSNLIVIGLFDSVFRADFKLSFVTSPGWKLPFLF